MRTIRSLFLLTLFLAGAMAAAPESARATEARLARLPNGLPVLVQPDSRFPLVSLRLYVRAGSAYEDPTQAGISHLLEHMVFKGTAKRAPGKAAEDIEGAGGYLNAATSFDHTVYIVDLPAASWTLGLDVIRDMAFGAVLDPEELEREKQVVISELERGEDSPGTLLFQGIQAMVWKGSPYERPIIGFRDTVPAITRQDILDYVAARYQPANCLLAVVGDVTPDEALAKAQEFFGDLANRSVLEEPLPRPFAPGAGGPQVKVRTGAWNKTYLAAAFPLPDLHSGDAAGLDLLAQILGGDETSRLYRTFKYRERLVDEISASASTLDKAGVLYIRATLDPANLEKFWPALNRELAGLAQTPFTEQEMARARLNLEDDLLRSKETLGGLASKLGYFQFFEGRLGAEDQYLRDLAAADQARLQALARAYLRPQALSAMALLPENSSLTGESLAAAAAEAWPAAAPGAKTRTGAAGGQAGAAQTVDLGSGRTLVLLPDPTLPYAAVHLVYPGGDTLLAPERQGLAEFTARSLGKGAGKRSATQVQDFLADRAADVSASAGRDLFTVSANYPTRFEEEVLGLFADTVLHPAFAEKELANARQEQAAAIRQREDQPLGLAFMQLFPFLYPDSPYGYLHLGLADDLARFDRKAVRGFWAEQRRQPWTLAACGSFDPDRVTALARKLAAADPAGSYAFPAAAMNGRGSKDLTLAKRNQTHIIVSFPAPGLDSPDSPGLDLLRQVLAGQGGVLFRELRDKQGLGYSVTALLWQAPKAGFLAFYIGTSPDKADQALAGFQAVVDGLRGQDLPADEVERAKNLMRGDYYREHQSLGSRSAEAAGLAARGYGLDQNRANIAAAARLAPDDLRRLADAWLQWDKSAVLRVVP
ncbi:MAG: pitrilysin family protein [Thermodesulfobacteriota bacterium]